MPDNVIPILITPETVKERSAVHSNVDNKLILPEIYAMQSLYIMPLLGSKLYKKILEDIKSNSLEGKYKELHESYLIDIMTNYVVSELYDVMNYQFWNTGVKTNTQQETSTPNYSEITGLKTKHKIRAEFFADQCRRYLKQYASEFFPEYLDAQEVSGLAPDIKSYSCPIYLGGRGDTDCG